MLMALILWLLGLVGVAPTDTALAQMQHVYFVRSHHVGVEFGGLFQPDGRSTGTGSRSSCSP